MKKSLLIILSLVLSQISTFAVGVDCWEEYSETFEPNTVSKMQSVLGNDVVITMVKADMRIATFIEEGGSYSAGYGWGSILVSVDYPISNVMPMAAYNSNDGKTYYPRLLAPVHTSGRYAKNTELYSPEILSYTSDGTSYNNIIALGRYDSDYSYTRLFLVHDNVNYQGAFKSYKFTYCIASDHSSSGGGGGGSAGAAVNYIIKAD